MKDYKREITHKNYVGRNFTFFGQKVEKYITERPQNMNYENVKSGKLFYYISDEFLCTPDISHIMPLGNIILASIFCIGTFFLEDSDSLIVIVARIFCVILIILSIIYYKTKPEKELIINRLDGIVTIPGAFYQKNITMSFDSIVFCFGENFELQVIRPGNYTYALFPKYGDLYHAMSFITWYMDKNRPLPPGTAFNKYRKKDYERRKAEGFPKPLYPSNVLTPEATPEQQAERERIGGW